MPIKLTLAADLPPDRETLRREIQRADFILMLLLPGHESDPFLLMQVSIAIELNRSAYILRKDGAAIPPALEASGLIAAVEDFNSAQDLSAHEAVIEKRVRLTTDSIQRQERQKSQ